MAWIVNEGNGRRRIDFRDDQRKIRSLRLGECSARDAERALGKFELVLRADRLNSVMDADAVEWLEGLSDQMYARIVRLGLVQPRKSAIVVTLDELLNRYMAAVTVKPTTRYKYEQVVENLRKHLGATTALDAITPANADEWRRGLVEEGLAPATVAKRVVIAKGVFHKAVRWGLLSRNPFADLRAGSQANPDRAHYIRVETIKAIMAACPNDEWRAIIALSRFAGLRCPSEIVLLRWGDVNWERGRLMVRSPKTAGHEGHAVRVVPIAPELRQILLALFDAAEEGAERVISRYRDPSINLRTQFERIIAKAGEKPWPRLFHNLRASCATDWVERFPAHVVAGWLGHSPMIAAQHYLQTRDAHFDLAAGIEPASENPQANPQAQARPSVPKGSQAKDKADVETRKNPGKRRASGDAWDLVGCGGNAAKEKRMPPEGLEPSTR
jgi:integrase